MSQAEGWPIDINFRNACFVVSSLFLFLSLTLVFFPKIVYWLFSLQQNYLGDFLAKRAGVLILGLPRRFSSG